jgi:hypothetical protein
VLSDHINPPTHGLSLVAPGVSLASARVEDSGRVLDVQDDAPISMRAVSDGDSRVLGAMSSLQGRLEAATRGAARGRRRGLSVAKGQKLKILPVAGTGAYHTNPISGGCLFGKNKVNGECNFYEKPVYGYHTIVNLPPPKGPPDANGFRALPPVKFPKALLSVQGEKLRKDGDLDWQLKVAQAMRSNDKKLTKLFKVSFLLLLLLLHLLLLHHLLLLLLLLLLLFLPSPTSLSCRSFTDITIERCEQCACTRAIPRCNNPFLSFLASKCVDIS